MTPKTETANPVRTTALPPAQGSALTARILYFILNALEYKRSALDELHCQAVSLGAGDPFIRNVALERQNLARAAEIIAALYDAQPPNDQAEPLPPDSERGRH